MIKGKLGQLKDKLKLSLSEENERTRLQFLFVFFIFSVISLFMAVVNYFTGFEKLMIATLVFAVLNVLNFAVSVKKGVLEKVARWLFSAEIIALFTFFVIIGEPQGFSAIWSALLPIGGMVLYRKKWGSILSAVQLAIMIFFFWTGIGQGLLQYEYTASFMLRFPLLYVVFYFVGLFFETVREKTSKELEEAKEKFEKLSYTDVLTGLGNEALYLKTVDSIEKRIKSGRSTRFAIVSIDLNNVKATNDKYGHRFGCQLIVEAGKKLPEIFRQSEIFHIGGDEFVVYVKGNDYNNLIKLIDKFDRELEYKKIDFEGKRLILSVARGYAFYKKGEKYTSVYQRADDAMYKNKQEQKEKYSISER